MTRNHRRCNGEEDLFLVVFLRLRQALDLQIFRETAPVFALARCSKDPVSIMS
jgi:hypothetical protein